ncbi:hypothetical protein D3C81_2100290 [compost metagenome]
MLVLGNTGWRFSGPMEDLHSAASGRDRDDVEGLVGPFADFHTRQITGLVSAEQGAGISLADFLLTPATAVIQVRLAIVRSVFTLQLIDLS